MSGKHTLGELNELAIALEHSAETIYRGLGKMFPDEPEVVLFWNIYANEEAKHAQWLEELRASQSDIQLGKPIDEILVEAALNLLKKNPDTILASVNNLEDAFQLAVFFESSETNVIFNFLITDSKLASKAKDFLRTQLNTHIERLDREFPKKFQTGPSRIAIPAKKIG